MSFRLPKVTLREAVGSYVSGAWTPGTKSFFTTQASVQPVVSSELDMKVLPEGRHLSDYVKVYTSSRLQVTADGEGIQPDIIVHLGYGYELVSLRECQSGVINHYHYVACKVFKFTSTAEWVAGTLKRPV